MGEQFVGKKFEAICPVCDEKAPEDGKHTPHYGGICCYSCRAFFRRAHQKTKNPQFTCRTAPDGSNIGLKKQCGYDVQTKRQCQYHRLKKCIEIGMNPDLVLTADQKVVHFRKHLKKVNKLEKIAARNGISKNGGIFISNSRKDLFAGNDEKTKDVRNSGLPQINPLNNVKTNLENRTEASKLNQYNSNEVNPSLYHLTPGNEELTNENDNRKLVPVATSRSNTKESTGISLCENTVIYTQQITPISNLQSNLVPTYRVIRQTPPSYHINTSVDIESQKTHLYNLKNIENTPKNQHHNTIKDHHEYWNLGHKCRLQQIKHLKRQRLAKINEIIETFVPAMRTTKMHKDFIVKIVNMHKDVSYQTTGSGNSNEIGIMNYSTKRQRLDKENSSNILTIVDLLSHFHALDESFVKFAESSQFFKYLNEEDKAELLKRNSQMFVMYLLARYFSSDVAMEQLSWLLKGCGISLPIEMVDFSDLIHLSDVTFSQFNEVCKIFYPEEHNEDNFRRFSECIQKINDKFQYPQYYNGLVALLLVFHSDETYSLTEYKRINVIFEEIKELVITGYEDFEDIGMHSLNMLIPTLQDMCTMFQDVKINDILHNAHNAKRSTESKAEEEYFVSINGVKVQKKPIDYSFAESKNAYCWRVHDLYHQIPMKNKLDCDEHIKSTYELFENAFGSVTSGFIITTMIDFTVGRLKKEDISPQYPQECFKLSVERFRRCLNVHPEFSEKLSCSDRTMLSKRNLSISGALLACKMESASSGAQQLMFRTGQLREESNIFWSLEFKNYHGLRTVIDIPYISMGTVMGKRLTSNQLEHYRGMIGYLKPLMEDPICFQLISMVMLLDTSDLSDDDITSSVIDKDDVTRNISHHILDTNPSTSQNSVSSHLRVGQRFQEIKSLHKHYVRLFHSRCIHSNNPELETLGGNNQSLNSTMQAIKQIAYYCSLVGTKK